MPRIQSALFPDLGRPVILGDYPYYRASPDRWLENLHELKSQGVDLVSFYLPWRFHETADAPGTAFDFSGATDPQRDVRLLLKQVGRAGLVALVKPGPFIHAEVQFGGLPDRLGQPDRHIPVVGLSGRPLTSQAAPLPSLRDPNVRVEVERWMEAVVAEVIVPFAAPAGPIVAMQLGNEGLYGDGNAPVTAQDASQPALDAFRAWLRRQGLDDLVATVRADPEQWPVGLRTRWSRWCGEELAAQWDWLAGMLPENLSTLLNVPLAPVSGTPSALDGWASRTTAVAGTPHLGGHTEWLGNASTEPDTFAAHLFGIQVADTDVVEANWGFTWADQGFARPAGPLFNALLALMLGSTTCAVYTACVTESWGSLIDMDPDGLRAECVDPVLHAPPYCPGAPTTESGQPGATAEALRLLRDFLRRCGSGLHTATPVVDAVLEIDRRLAEEQAWALHGPTVLQQVAITLGRLERERGVRIQPRWLTDEPYQPPDGVPHAVVHRDGSPPRNGLLRLGLDPTAAPGSEVTAFLRELADSVPATDAWRSGRGGHAAVIRRIDQERRREYVGVFNPTGKVDVIVHVSADGRWELTSPPQSAAVLVLRDGAPEGWISTPLPGDATVTLVTPDREFSDSDWYGGIDATALPDSR